MLGRIGKELQAIGQRYNGLRSFISLLESPVLRQSCNDFLDCERLSSEVFQKFMNSSKPLVDRVNEANNITAPIDNFILKSMYWDFKIPSLKFIECTRQQPLFQKWFLWDSEESFTGFGFACFKTVDNTMFDESYSKELYGLHGAGEVLVAKHLFMNFGHIQPADALEFGDMVLMKDPRGADGPRERLLVRRIGALPGETVESASNPEDNLKLAPHEVWVMADNDEGESEEFLPRDSRTFGPVDAREHIFGRVVYSIRTAVDHSPVKNPSPRSRALDRENVFALDDHEVVQKFLETYST